MKRSFLREAVKYVDVNFDMMWFALNWMHNDYATYMIPKERREEFRGLVRQISDFIDDVVKK